jgi:hypothetical protein
MGSLHSFGTGAGGTTIAMCSLPVLKGKCIPTHADCIISVTEFNICILFGVLTACFGSECLSIPCTAQTAVSL